LQTLVLLQVKRPEADCAPVNALLDEHRATGTFIVARGAGHERE
jgi:hypothetical protein